MPVRPPAGPEAHARGGPEVISEIFLSMLTRRTRLGLDEGITAPATAGPHAHSNAACFARHRLAVVVRTVVVGSNRRGTRTTIFRKIIARHRAKRLERNGTNGQDRHATSFPIPLGPQEMPRDSRDEAGQRRPSPFSRRAVSNRRGNRTTTFSKDQRAASREEMRSKRNQRARSSRDELPHSSWTSGDATRFA